MHLFIPDYRCGTYTKTIMNGETQRIITTFYRRKEQTREKSSFREVIPIGETETAGSLHFKMMQQGTELVLKTLDTIARGNYQLKDQRQTHLRKEIEPALCSKIGEDCKIIWLNSAKNIFKSNPEP